MESKINITVLMFFALFTSLLGQNPADSLLNDTKQLAVPSVDSLIPDSLRQDSLTISPSSFDVSDDALDDEVNYDAKDSMIYDIKNKKVHLYGDAIVDYTSIHLEAGYIVFDWEANTVTAEEFPDSTGLPAGTPSFSDGGENFDAKKIRYNFKSRKGIIYEAVTQQNDLYVRSEVGKFVSAQPGPDSTETDDVIYSKNAIFTSCDAEVPHYGIRSNKQKVVPNKTVVVGPSNLEIGGVPTPLVLPFGFFPITSRARAGLVFPSDYQWDPNFGFGLSDVGFFTPLGQYANLKVTGEVYFKNRWGLNLNSSYKKKYKFNGSATLNYASFAEEVGDGALEERKAFSFRWNHQQDPNAHPTMNFSGNVDISTNNFNRALRNDANNVLNNTLNSNLNYSYRPKDKPFNFTAGFDHSQNNLSRQITFNFPNLNFQTQRIYPFKQKGKGSKEDWYEKLGFTYRANAKNRYTDTDTTLFQGNWINRMQYGAQHDVNADITLNVLKYFRVSPRVSYGETYYFQQLERTFDPTTLIDSVNVVYNEDSSEYQIIYDTTYGQIINDTLDLFKPYRRFDAGVTVNFDLFGTMLFKKGWLRGLRHYAKPSISLNYAPNYRDPGLGYIDSVDTDNRAEFNERIEYNRFLGGVYSTPSIRDKQATIGFGINNIFQAKYFSKKDSTIKYFNLADEFS
ncbi:MAG: putative LPS assembly protein LptD [Saprospiraceae bacterium]